MKVCCDVLMSTWEALQRQSMQMGNAIQCNICKEYYRAKLLTSSCCCS